jgi:hypothetical protein
VQFSGVNWLGFCIITTRALLRYVPRAGTVIDEMRQKMQNKSFKYREVGKEDDVEINKFLCRRRRR